MNWCISLKEKINSLPKILINSFFVALFFALLTNGIALTREVKNFDCILFASGNETLGQSLNQGRYVIFILQNILNGFLFSAQVYYFNLLLSFVIVSFAACIIVDILDIKNEILAYIFAALFTSYVSITCMVFYSFASVIYSLALLFALFSLKNMYKRKIVNYIIAVIMLVISMGIYQSYLTIPICLINILFIKEMLFNKEETYVKIIKKYIIYVVIVILAYVINALIINLFLNNYEVSLDTGITRGASDFTSYIFSNLSFFRIIDAYKDVIFLGTTPYGYVGYINNNPILYKVYLISLFLSIVLFIYMQIKLKRPVGNVILSIIAFAFLPLSYGLLEILFPDMVDGLQLLNLVFYIALPLIMLDNLYNAGIFIKDNKGIFKIVISDFVVLCSVICIFTYSYYGNRNIKSLCDMNDSVHLELERLVTRIQSTPEYSYEAPIAIVGNRFPLFTYFDREMNVGYRGVNMNNLASADDLKFMLKNYRKFMFDEITPEGIAILQTMDEFKNMNVYPNDGSIKMIEGCLVVRLAD